MFHVRQTASTLATWRASGGEHAIRLASAAPAAGRLHRELRARQPLPGVRVDPPGLVAPAAAGATALVGPGEVRGPGDVEVSPALAPPSGPDAICWPLDGPFLELHAGRGVRSELALALQRAGFQVALSRGGAYGGHQLLAAFLAPLAAAVLAGETTHTIDRALRELGLFRRSPGLIGALGPGAAVALTARALDAGPSQIAAAIDRLAQPADFRAGRDAPELVDEVLLWLVAAARDSAFQHPSFVDLAARELLTFPVARLSLCAYLTPARVQRALAGAPPRTPARIREVALAYAQAGRGFYR
jgi:hypothetical protein